MARYFNEKKHSSVFTKDGHLDVKKLERECCAGLTEDRRYRRVDDMKKKAIHVSGSYDEFKNFVACAEDNLQPVSSTEFKELTKGRVGWGHTAAARATKHRDGRGGNNAGDVHGGHRTLALAEGVGAKGKPKAPRTPLEFERDWRRCRKMATAKTKAPRAKQITAARRTDYLKVHGPEVLGKVFASELDATLMTEVLDVVAAPWLDFAEESTKDAAAPPKDAAAPPKDAAAPPPPPDTAAAPAAPPADAAPPPPPEPAAAAAAALAADVADAIAWFRAVARAPRFSLNVLMFEKELAAALGAALANLAVAAGDARRGDVAELRATYADCLK
jgi:hypothetical protein